jgi:hypothetical protein
MIGSIVFYIWLAGYVITLLAVAKTYQEGYLNVKDALTFAFYGVLWPAAVPFFFMRPR